jgi:hypothetical protein
MSGSYRSQQSTVLTCGSQNSPFGEARNAGKSVTSLNLTAVILFQYPSMKPRAS